jgi:hypothetical protein
MTAATIFFMMVGPHRYKNERMGVLTRRRILTA